MIFFDNASTTKCYEKCQSIVDSYLFNNYFNPSSPYHYSIELSKSIESSRENMLGLLKARNGQFIFTSSGSESDNLALFGTKKPNKGRIITTRMEHAAIFNSANELIQRGYDVCFCDTDKYGKVDFDSFKQLMTENTCLVSFMHVNNETGAINDIEKLCTYAKSVNKHVVFHSDGVQAFGKLPVNLDLLGVDLYSVSGHKIHAPKGIGGLFIKNGISLHPLIFGGGQEKSIRSSTENVSGIKCFDYSASEIIHNMSNNITKVTKIRNIITDSIVDGNNVIQISPVDGSPYILTLALKKVRGEVMVRALSMLDILIGTGSACSSRKSNKRISSELSLPTDYVDGIIRLSFSDFNNETEALEFVKAFNEEFFKLKKYVG